MTETVYYSRCPVPTASGIAFQRRLFAPMFEGSGYEVRDICELGPTYRDAHYTHSIPGFFREGGGAPPIWARSGGADSVLLGVTFMEELLGIFVRADDPASRMTDLTGRRLALPIWPRLVFNFWRFAAYKGITSALEAHAMSIEDVELVEVIEGWDPHERRDVEREDAPTRARCEYRNQLHALLEGRVDAIFGKGPEAALLEQEGEGKIRLLYDLREADPIGLRVNNSTPRTLTTSRTLLQSHPESVVRYLQALIRATRWANHETGDARALVARECSVQPDEIERYLDADYLSKLLPVLTDDLLSTVEIQKTFLLEHGFIEQDFSLTTWVAPEPLAEAYRREDVDREPRGQRR